LFGGGKTIVLAFVDTHDTGGNPRGILDKQNGAFLANLAYGVTSGSTYKRTKEGLLSGLVDTGEISGLRAFIQGLALFQTNNFQANEKI